MIDALYCHIPFCHSICPFCPFAVHGNRRRLHGDYLEALRAEIARRGREYDGGAQAVASLYVGGGTPSTLSLEEVDAVLGWLRTAFRLLPDAEIAFECNPEDLTPAYLAGLQRLGVNRVSVGLQSLDDATLAALGRGHRGAESRRSLELLRRCGPAHHNVDLMFGAPGIAPAAFRADVRRVLERPPPHLSLYGLDIEEGTPFGRDTGVRRWAEAHREEQEAAYLWASDTLRAAGYRHYEVSNFCRPGHAGAQNRIVWDGGNYLGFGTGAHSHVDGVRWHNHRHLRAYRRAIAGGHMPEAARETLSAAQRANEALMLALRREEGLDTAAWSRRFGHPWAGRRRALARRLTAGGLARAGPGRLALTPRGFLVADGITAELMVD